MEPDSNIDETSENKAPDLKAVRFSNIAEDGIWKKNVYGNWYVFQTYTGREAETVALCESRIKKEGERVFYPIKEKSSRRGGKPIMVESALFPGYVFVETDDIKDFYLRLRKVPKMTKLLSIGDEVYPIYAEEEQYLRKMLDGGFRLRVSEGYMEGDRLVITSGGLIGMEGNVVKVLRSKKLAVLEIQFMGRRTEITVGLDIVEKREW